MRLFRSPLAVVLLLCPMPGFAQTQTPRVGGEVIGTASMFRYPRDEDGKWRPAAGARARVVFLGWTHLELGYTKAWTREERLCPLDGPCPQTTDTPSDILSVAAGLQAGINGWVPYFGFGTGTFSNENFDSRTFVWYLGLQRELVNRLSILGEYRRTRFESYSGQDQSNQAWEIGGVVRYP